MLQITALDRPLAGRSTGRQRAGGPARHGLGARLRGAARRCRSSLTVGLVGLVVMLAVVPIVYYDQQRQSEDKYGSMLRLWADNETRLAARALAPTLEAPGAAPFRVVQDQLSV